MDAYAKRGLRVIGLARRALLDEPIPEQREDAERDLTFLGLVAMFDPPRPEVADAVRQCHEAGIRIIVVTGDHGLTAAEVARKVGIARDGVDDRHRRGTRPDGRGAARPAARRLGGADLRAHVARGEAADRGRAPRQRRDRRDDGRRRQRRARLCGAPTSASPWAEAARTSRARPRRWCSRTTTSRRSSAQSRKAGGSTTTSGSSSSTSSCTPTPEVVPFLVFALSGGLIPLALTVALILAIDLGTETLPALALGREPVEPGTMQRPPRRAVRGCDSTGDARACVALPRRDLGRARDGRVLLRPAACRLEPGRLRLGGLPAARRLPRGDDDHLPRDRRLPDRHGARRAHRAGVAALDRSPHEPAPPVGLPLRARVRGCGRLRAAPPGSVLDRGSRPGRAGRAPSVPVRHLGRRRAAPAAPAPPTAGAL